MPKLHISQDDTGFWQLSFEDDDGSLTLISHQFPAPDHLIEDARELVAKGKVPERRHHHRSAAAGSAQPRQGRRHYSKPAPRKAVE